jgi:hypothetical protein
MYSHVVYRPRRRHFCVEPLGVEFPIISRVVIRLISRPAPTLDTSQCAPASASLVPGPLALGALSSGGAALIKPEPKLSRWVKDAYVKRQVALTRAGGRGLLFVAAE